MEEGQNIDIGDRGVRLLTSFGSLAVLGAHEGPLNGWVALAFVAVYCVFTGITAWDPFYALFKRVFMRFNQGAEVSTPGEIGQYGPETEHGRRPSAMQLPPANLSQSNPRDTM